MLLVHDTFQVLNQLITVIQQLSGEEYKKPLNVLSGQSVGSHTRHVLEFYTCLLEGSLNGIVDYDSRKRDLTLEHDPAKALEMLEKTICKIVNQSLDAPLRLRVTTSDTTDRVDVETSYFRELSYNIEHVVHHLALIRIAIEQQFTSVVLPEHFGVAYATIQYRSSCAH